MIDRLETLIVETLNINTRFFQRDINELKTAVKTLPTQDVLNKLNSLRVTYLNHHLAPTVYHLETVELAHLLQTIIETFIKENHDYVEWWNQAQAETKIKEYAYSYSSLTL